MIIGSLNVTVYHFNDSFSLGEKKEERELQPNTKSLGNYSRNCPMPYLVCYRQREWKSPPKQKPWWSVHALCAHHVPDSKHWYLQSRTLGKHGLDKAPTPASENRMRIKSGRIQTEFRVFWVYKVAFSCCPVERHCQSWKSIKDIVGNQLCGFKKESVFVVDFNWMEVLCWHSRAARAEKNPILSSSPPPPQYWTLSLLAQS